MEGVANKSVKLEASFHYRFLSTLSDFHFALMPGPQKIATNIVYICLNVGQC